MRCFVESAWEGVEGLWHRKSASTGTNRSLSSSHLLSHCNARGVPTIFWNKEDPVHFNRFRVTAKYFDHVFTTDADCIRKYLSGAGDQTQDSQRRCRSMLSLSFTTSCHPSGPYEHAVTYAGSYYGEKYPKRSAELSQLLTAANTSASRSTTGSI